MNFEKGTVKPDRFPRRRAMRNTRTGEVLYRVSGRVVTASAPIAATFRKNEV